jgi:hypothetical protein
MAKKRLLEDMLRNPARFYRNPADVLRDRRFEDGDRAEILRAWLAADDARGAEIAAALSELESRGITHAAE